MTTTVGIGLRSQHLNQLLEDPFCPVFLEVHAENYLRPSPSLEKVLRLRHDFEFSVHAVGLSLGSADGVDEAHLDQVARTRRPTAADTGIGAFVVELFRGALLQ